jgi:hypothetical protein
MLRRMSPLLLFLVLFAGESDVRVVATVTLAVPA